MPQATLPPRSVPSLIHDTTYRRIRRRAIRGLHDVDDRLSQVGTRCKRVLFEAGSPMNVAIMRPVYDRLCRDPRLDLRVTAPAGVWQPEEIFNRAGIATDIVPPSKAVWMKVDAYVNADFWEMTWLHRRTCRIHLFHGVAGKYGLDAPVDIAPVVAAFDCLMFENADRRRRYLEAGLVPDDPTKAPVVGYPKVDCLVDGSLDRGRILGGLGLDARIPTIIYALTWSHYSSLNRMAEEIIERIASEGLQVIVKLHDRSYDGRERASGGIDRAEQLSRFESHPRIRIVRAPDASPFLVAADGMVSDHSSIVFEYMILDRPIVVIDCPELIIHAAIHPDDLRRLRAATEVVARAPDVAAALVRALRQPDARSSQRRHTADELFYKPGSATDRAVALLYRMIGLPAPVEAQAAVEHDRALAAVG
jgi:hypothetical protein